jgi:hypothetical protein
MQGRLCNFSRQVKRDKFVAWKFRVCGLCIKRLKTLENQPGDKHNEKAVKANSKG